MTRPLVFLFPGQSSRDPEMFERLAALAPERTRVALAHFERLAGHPFTGRFETNLEIQLAVHLAIEVWHELAADTGLRPVASAGMSLGEYAHLVEIGALDADAARELVRERGRCYDRGPDGAMAVVQPVAEDDLESLLERVRDEMELSADDLAISNENSPTQLVIAGRSDAVLRAATLAEEELYAATTVIERRVPMHVRRFRPAAAAFLPRLERAAWSTPCGRWWSNLDGAAVHQPQRADLVRRMYRHVFQPVRWRRLVENLVDAHPGAVLVEVGPRSVLTDLIGRRRWLRGVTAIALDRSSDPLPRRFEEVCRAVDL